MRLDRNICSKCNEKNFSDDEYNTSLGMCNECFLKHYKQIQKRISEIKKNKVWIDEETELMWELKQKESIDEIYIWDEVFNYVKALNIEKYAGYSDWRVPTIYELKTILTKMVYKNTYNSDVYIKKELALDTVASNDYWSSSENVSDSSYAWSVYFSYGGISSSYKFFKGYIRCVRGRP